MRRSVLLAPAFALVLAGCPQASAPSDGGAPVADGGVDAGALDDAGPGGGPDAGVDAGPAVAPGFGVITGPCGVLDDELTAPAPGYVQNAIDFGSDPYDDGDLARLTAGGQEILSDGNAGGSSLLSEVFAFEVLDRCEGAVLLKTETEVSYVDPQGKITDLLVEIDGLKIGVSVTRAVAFPFEDPYTVEQARAILEQKLQGVLDASANVAPEDAWVKQILHVIAYAPGHAGALEQALGGIDAALKADTIVYVTVSDGDDAFLY